MKVHYRISQKFEQRLELHFANYTTILESLIPQSFRKR